MSKLVYQTLEDIRGQLIQCYSGEDHEMFKQIVPCCKQCKEVAIGTINCSICSKSILCEPCVVEGISACKKCLKNSKVNPQVKLTVNSTAKSILQAAKFHCPYTDCPCTNIAYDDLEKHMTVECEYK